MAWWAISGLILIFGFFWQSGTLYGCLVLHKTPKTWKFASCMQETRKHFWEIYISWCYFDVNIIYFEILTLENFRLEVNKAFSENMFIISMCVWWLLSCVWEDNVAKKCTANKKPSYLTFKLHHNWANTAAWGKQTPTLLKFGRCYLSVAGILPFCLRGMMARCKRMANYKANMTNVTGGADERTSAGRLFPTNPRTLSASLDCICIAVAVSLCRCS